MLAVILVKCHFKLVLHEGSQFRLIFFSIITDMFTDKTALMVGWRTVLLFLVLTDSRFVFKCRIASRRIVGAWFNWFTIELGKRLLTRVSDGFVVN